MMSQNKILHIIVFIITISIIFSGCSQQKTDTEDLCNKKTIYKTNCCTIDQFFGGAEYDPETNTCKQTGGDCCTEFPFKNLEECQNVCISK
jgi:hypothetical protein